MLGAVLRAGAHVLPCRVQRPYYSLCCKEVGAKDKTVNRQTYGRSNCEAQTSSQSHLSWPKCPSGLSKMCPFGWLRLTSGRCSLSDFAHSSFSSFQQGRVEGVCSIPCPCRHWGGCTSSPTSCSPPIMRRERASSTHVLQVPCTNLNVSNYLEGGPKLLERAIMCDPLTSLPSSHKPSMPIRGGASGFLTSWSNLSLSLEQQHHDVLYAVDSTLALNYLSLIDLENMFSLSLSLKSFAFKHIKLSNKNWIGLSKMRNVFVIQEVSALPIKPKASASYGCKACKTKRWVRCDNKSGKFVPITKLLLLLPLLVIVLILLLTTDKYV